MRGALIVFLVAVIAGWIVTAAPAQDEQQVQVTVTSASGRSVFLNRGSGDGIVPGLTVQFFPPTGGPIEGIVRDVSTNSARVEFPPDIPLPPIGTRGELLVPAGAGGAEPPPGGNVPRPREVPDHPPWTRQEGELSEDAPLLSPAFGRPPNEREVRFDGRVFSRMLYTYDQGTGRNSHYFFGRLGTWVEATNLFGQGGRTLFAGDLNHRAVDLRDDTDSSTRIRVDRLSYALGGQDWAAYRLEMGRFYSIHVPELGLFDGVEGVVQLENGMRAGGGVGVYPRPFPGEGWGEDTGLHVFVDYQSEADHALAAALAFQKTWHEGAPDRDLMLGRLSLHPTDALWLFSSWRVDFYTTSDTIKGAGAQLTELWAQARYSPDPKKGVALTLSHFSWPELKRREFDILPPDLIRDGLLDRVDLSGWYKLRNDLRLSGRFDFWHDQRDDGYSAEIGADWSDPKGKRPHVHAAVHYTEGSFTDGLGLRLQARQRIGPVYAFLGYDLFRFTTAGGLAGVSDATRHTIRGGVDWNVGKWYYSLTGDYYYSKTENAFTLGVFAQYRF